MPHNFFHLERIEGGEDCYHLKHGKRYLALDERDRVVLTKMEDPDHNPVVITHLATRKCKLHCVARVVFQFLVCPGVVTRCCCALFIYSFALLMPRLRSPVRLRLGCEFVLQVDDRLLAFDHEGLPRSEPVNASTTDLSDCHFKFHRAIKVSLVLPPPFSVPYQSPVS